MLAATPAFSGPPAHVQRTLNADAFVSFALDADGHVREVRMNPISPLTDFSFDFQDLRMKPVDKDGDGD